MPQPWRDLDAPVARQRVDHGLRHRRAAAQDLVEVLRLAPALLELVDEPEPHRRHAPAGLRALAVHQVEERGAVEPGARQDQRAAGERRDVGQAPGVGVEQRHDRQDPAVVGEQVGARGDQEERVQHHAAVGVEHAFGLAGGARGVAQRAGGVLVELRPFRQRVHLVEQALVAEQAAELPARRHVLAVGHEHVGLDALQRRRELLHQRQEGEVEEQRRVAGVVGDVGDLLLEQARVDGVADGADAGDGVVELEVAVAVPGEGRHPVARLDAEADERVGEPADALARGAVAVAVQAAFDGLGDDLHIGVDLGRVVDHARHQQRPIHHQPAQHGHGPPGRVSLCWHANPVRSRAPSRPDGQSTRALTRRPDQKRRAHPWPSWKRRSRATWRSFAWTTRR